MITDFHIQGYGCIQDATLKLTPFHALIGPNDSGKSTVLRALAGVMNRSIDDDSIKNAVQLTVHASLPQNELSGGVQWRRDGWRVSGADAVFTEATDTAIDTILSRLGPVRTVRLDAGQMKAASNLLTERELMDFPRQRGHELAGIYNAILGRGDDAFQRISASVRKLFPSIVHLRVEAINQSAIVLGARLVDGTVIRAHQMSEGLLYYLAFFALVEVSKARLLLIEEPENGLHPARIAEVMRMLRDFSANGTQIIIATHSPLVINELQPNEVSIVTRSPETGTKITPIAETKHFAERSAVYNLGELWLSYANGIDEADLLNGTEAE